MQEQKMASSLLPSLPFIFVHFLSLFARFLSLFDSSYWLTPHVSLEGNLHKEDKSYKINVNLLPQDEKLKTTASM
jgi:hypothetical protein